MEAKNKRVAPKTFGLLNQHWPTGQPPATFGFEHMTWGKSKLRCAVSVKYILGFEDLVWKTN